MLQISFSVSLTDERGNKLEKVMDDLTGKRFGRLLVTEFAGRGKQGKALWRCQCECGTVRIVRAQALRIGQQSCGCLHREAMAIRMQTHGHDRAGKRTPEYAAFCNAKSRCENPRDHAYSHYGGRGIRFLFVSFEQFFAELGPPAKGLTLDRIDNDGPYAPGNVRWATWSQQARNKRTTVYPFQTNGKEAQPTLSGN
jgi:hypothetical protein